LAPQASAVANTAVPGPGALCNRKGLLLFGMLLDRGVLPAAFRRRAFLRLELGPFPGHFLLGAARGFQLFLPFSLFFRLRVSPLTLRFGLGAARSIGLHGETRTRASWIV
jgi:hypothetical protein